MAPGALRIMYGAWRKFGVFIGGPQPLNQWWGGGRPMLGFGRSYYVQWPLSRTGHRAKPVIQNPVLLRVSREGCPWARS